MNIRLFTLNDGAGPQIAGAHVVGVIDCVQTVGIYREHYYSDGVTDFSNINGRIEIRQIAIAFESLPCQPSGQEAIDRSGVIRAREGVQICTVSAQ